MKTLLLILALAPMPGHARDVAPDATFAFCAGRFSAELEHAWLMSDPHMDALEHHRAQFLDLLGAVMLPERRSQTLNARISAKAAHAALLSEARFSRDPARADWARGRARSEIAYCEGLLLKS